MNTGRLGTRRVTASSAALVLGGSLLLTGCGGSGTTAAGTAVRTGAPISAAKPAPSTTAKPPTSLAGGGDFCGNIKRAVANKDQILKEIEVTAMANTGRGGLDGMQKAMEKAYGLYLPVLAAAPAQIQPQAKVLAAQANRLLTAVKQASNFEDFSQRVTQADPSERQTVEEAESGFDSYVKAHCGVDVKADIES